MTDWDEVDDNLTTHAYFSRQDYHEVFTAMRREDPVHWTKGNHHKGYWSLARYEDCKAVLEQPVLFSSTAGNSISRGQLSDEQKQAVGFDVKIHMMDPPQHPKMRGPLNKHFSIPVVARMRQNCEDVVADLIENMRKRDVFDINRDVAAVLPVHVFLSMMGVPREDWDRIQGFTAKVGSPTDPEVNPEGRDPIDLYVEGAQELHAYLIDHLALKRDDPAEDFGSWIAHMDVDGKPLDERAAAWMAWNVVSGGLETTKGAAAIAILELAQRPEQVAVMLQDQKVLKGAVEEVIRWANPSKNRLRVATEDCVIGDKQIRAGDWVVPWLVSANRDEEVFERADQFDVTRNPNPHIGFGIGAHVCLGRNVARLQLEVLMRELFTNFPDIRVVEEPEWLGHDEFTAVTKLMVAV